MDGIKSIYEKLKSMNIEHNDFALRNLCIDEDDIIHLIDFESGFDKWNNNNLWLCYLRYDFETIFGVENADQVMNYITN